MRFARAHAHVRALMMQNSCAVGMRNAILRNYLKLHVKEAWLSWTNHNSLVHLATNEIASVCADNRLRQMAFFVFVKVCKGQLWHGFRVMLKDFEIEKLFQLL